MITLKDSRGSDSHTLGLISLSWLTGTAVFLAAAWNGQYPIAEYGIFVGTNLAPYIFREYKEKDKGG
jgi:hypothetical protein